MNTPFATPGHQEDQMTAQQEPARENLREFIDKLVDQGYTVRDGQSPDPDLIDPGGSAVETWREGCLLYTSPSPRDRTRSRMPSSA